MRILIINPFGIGDVLFTTPLIANLKEAFPDSYIGYVCNARAKDILLNNPKINKVFIYEKDRFRKLWKESRILCIRQFFKLLRSIKMKKFDVVFDLSLAQEYGFFSWLIGIRKRVGYNYKGRGIFLTNKIKLDGFENKHAADYHLDLLRLIGIEPKHKDLEFPLAAQAIKWANEYLAENNIHEQDTLIGLIPGGGASWGENAYRKQWPPNRFADIGNRMADEFKAKIIIFGDDNEFALCNQVASLIRGTPIVVSKKTTLSKFAALLRRCSLVICNDGGPLHLAVSQGVRTISIFGPVDPAVYGPYPRNENHVVIRKDMDCQPCYEKFKLKDCANADCLTAIESKEVMAAAEKFLNSETGGA